MPRVDITPDRSLIKKLGLTGYRTEQAVAELIDNSIDARIPGRREDVYVRLDFGRREITVGDSGAGMDLDGLRDALTLAKETKGEEGKLGRFGLGMKSACSALGRKFHIRTAREGSDTEYSATYDEKKWLVGGSGGWSDFEIAEAAKREKWHGTVITVTNLNVPMYPNQAVNFRRRFDIRYGPYLRGGQVGIAVNSSQCSPAEPEVEEGSRKEIRIEVLGGKITGWIGLLKKRSAKGDYGMHLYRRGRLIRAFDRFGIRDHPEVAKVVGELHLDHVPVNVQKTEFVEESYKYREAVYLFNGNRSVADTLRGARRGKAGSAEASAILERIGERPAAPTGARISARDARALLKRAGKIEIKGAPGRAEMAFVDRGSGLYSVRKDSGAFRIEVNRRCPVFRAFKNPLLLVGMIRAEADLIMRDPAGLEGFLRERNRSWEGLAAGWPAEKGRPPRDWSGGGITLPTYALSGDLIGVHEHLMEWCPYEFQFTGLSTLAPFMHHAYNTIIYSVQTEPRAGEELRGHIMDADGDFTVLHEPGREGLQTAIELMRGKIIVIRESSEKTRHTWAGPEKAWLDLYVEIVKRRLNLYAGELPMILESMTSVGLVNMARLRSMAARRKLQGGIEEHMEE